MVVYLIGIWKVVMDRKIYWKIRERILNILFKCRVFTYKRINKIETLKDSVPLGIVIIKKAILGLIKGIAIAAILWIIDQIILERESFFTLDRNVFIDVIIGCVGVAGIILGLYCTNISSIYSSKYANDIVKKSTLCGLLQSNHWLQFISRRK